MSAFLLVSTAHQGVEYLEATRKQENLRRKGRKSLRSTKSLSSSVSGESTKTRTSTGSATPSDCESNKTKLHLSKKDPESALKHEIASQKFEKDLVRLKSTKFVHFINRMNEQTSMNGFDPNSSYLFSKRNLEVLRHIYFANFIPNYCHIHDEIRLNHFEYIDQIDSFKNSPVINGLPLCVDPSNNDNQFKLTPTNSIESGQIKSIRGTLKSGQLWNDIFQDMRFEHPEEFECLPSLPLTRNFLVETFDYFLYHILELESLYKKSNNKHFVYFRDADFEWFHMMSNVHLKMYENQAKLAQGHIGDIQTFKIINTLLSTIHHNLELSIVSRSASKEDREDCYQLLKFWKELMEFIFFDMVLDVPKYNPPAKQEEFHSENLDTFKPGFRVGDSSFAHAEDDSKSTRSARSARSSKGSIFSKFTRSSISSR